MMLKTGVHNMDAKSKDMTSYFLNHSGNIILICLIIFQMKVLNKHSKVFTELHQSVFKDLFSLCINRYSEVCFL